MKTKNGFSLFVNISDNDIDLTSEEEYVDCGQASLGVIFDGSPVYRDYRVLMKSDFFEMPDESACADLADFGEEAFFGDLYIKISLNEDGSSIKFDTDVESLMKSSKESVTLGLIDPVLEDISDDDSSCGTYIASGVDRNGKTHYFLVYEDDEEMIEMSDIKSECMADKNINVQKHK